MTDPDVSPTRQYIVEVATTAGPLAERFDTYDEAVARVEALPADLLAGIPFIFRELPDGSQRLVRNDGKPLQWHRLEHERDIPLGDDLLPLSDDLPPEAEVPIINIESADSRFASAYLSFTSDILEANQITDYLVRIVQPRLTALQWAPSRSAGFPR